MIVRKNNVPRRNIDSRKLVDYVNIDLSNDEKRSKNNNIYNVKRLIKITEIKED